MSCAGPVGAGGGGVPGRGVCAESETQQRALAMISFTFLIRVLGFIISRSQSAGLQLRDSAAVGKRFPALACESVVNNLPFGARHIQSRMVHATRVNPYRSEAGSGHQDLS